jgi:hypothetical protein
MREMSEMSEMREDEGKHSERVTVKELPQTAG